MLRKAAREEGKDWDNVIPYLLFAYREAPQASTGFSPFELLYKAPFDVLSDAWVKSEHSDDSIVSYVLSTRQKLHQMRDIVKENLEASQDLQKLWYDKKVVSRSSVKEIKF